MLAALHCNIRHCFVDIQGFKQKKGMTDQELKELMAKSAQAHTEILRHCDEELKRSVIAKRRKKNNNNNKKTHR